MMVHNSVGCVSCGTKLGQNIAPPALAGTIWRGRPVTTQTGRDKALTIQEAAVLECIARGFDVVETASKLRTTSSGIKMVRHRIFAKLGVSCAIGQRTAGRQQNDAALLAIARARGLVPQVPA